MSAFTPPPVPGCLWAADRVLVRVRRAAKLALPQALLRAAGRAGVACALSLADKAEYLAAGGDAPADPRADAPGEPAGRRRRQPPLFTSCQFWPEAGELPTARQVRQATGFVEDAHAAGLRVLLNGAGHPARAALAAGCWLAREGFGGDLLGERLGWLEEGQAGPAGGAAGRTALVLSAAERTFVEEWPTGRAGQPELADLAWAEPDEVFPFAPVEHWLRVLPTVRVYLAPRGRAGFVDVPVVDGQRVSDGADIDLDLDELRRGVWVGERTLRLPNGWQVVFNSPRR